MHFSELKQLRWGQVAQLCAQQRERESGKGKMQTSERRALSAQSAQQLTKFHKLSASVARNLIQLDLAKFRTHHMISCPLSLFTLCLSLSCSITALANVKSTNAMCCGWLRCRCERQRRRRHRHFYWGVGSWVKIIDTGEVRCRRTRLLLFLFYFYSQADTKLLHWSESLPSLSVGPAGLSVCRRLLPASSTLL